MILRCELGKVIEEKIEKAALGEIVYSLPYDVNEKGMFSENFFVITHKNLISILHKLDKKVSKISAFLPFR